MRKIEEIEGAIRGLSPAELADFRRWFAEFDADAWDRQLEADSKSGALGGLLNEAIQDRREGRCTDR